MSVWTVVLAAGSGDRFGGAVPKQYAPLGDRRVLDWSLSTARAASDGVVLAVAAAHVDDPEPLADRVVAGGATRSESVRAGLAALPPDCEIVVVHDAARPLASVELYRAVIDVVRAGAVAAVPALAVPDTIKRVEGDAVVETLAREQLVAVQTPQAFTVEVLRRAHASGADATDDAALVEVLGEAVRVVEGEQANRKITHARDLAAAAASIDAASGSG